jgi:hypothetical protein
MGFPSIWEAWVLTQLLFSIGLVILSTLARWNIWVFLVIQAVWTLFSLFIWVVYLDEKDRTVGTVDRLFQRKEHEDDC